MAQNFLAIVCSQAIIDKESNSLSLIEALEDVFVVGDPEDIATGQVANLKMNARLVTGWIRDDSDTPEETEVDIKVVLASGKEVELARFDVDLKDSERSRFITRITGFPMSGPGLHRILIKCLTETSSGKKRWVTVAKVPINIVFVPNEEMSESSD